MLEKELGKKLSTKEVAEYLGLDEKTVRLYYQKLGGMRLGRRYVFFEKEIINAIQKRTKMESPSSEGRKTDRENIQHEKRGCRLGSRNEEKTRRRMGREDRHGLFV